MKPANFPEDSKGAGGINIDLSVPAKWMLNTAAATLDRLTSTKVRYGLVVGALSLGTIVVDPIDVLNGDSYDASYQEVAPPYDRVTGLRGPLPEGAELGPISTGMTIVYEPEDYPDLDVKKSENVVAGSVEESPENDNATGLAIAGLSVLCLAVLIINGPAAIRGGRPLEPKSRS